MSTLIIRHTGGGGDGATFHVERLTDGKRTKPVAIDSPVSFPVEGRPHSGLMRELRWYLEWFLDYPFEPETEHAERVLESLRNWGRQTFNALFDSRQGGEFLKDALDGGHYDRLRLQVSSDDPRILAWPWEGLEDPEAGLLAQTCQIDRRLNEVVDPPDLDENLPRDRVNILLVTARPYEQDVRYRSISRPLVELIEKHRLPAHVTVLRPPTFDELRRHLHEHPHHYHILHFDGHGGYGEGSADEDTTTDRRHSLLSPRGVLVFEDKDGKPEEVGAKELSNLLRESAVPAVVLNACQSAMIDARAEDAFASVAASLLKSGTRSVVAMAYSLYVSAAQQFLPAFYERLFEVGDAAQAVRTGRQQMLAHKDRICARGRYPLQDWLVPVVYQQKPMDFSFAAEAKKTAQPRESRLPEGARDEDNPYGFIGRDGPLLALERAMLRPPAGILIHGLGGIGKTTLARGFVQWLETTEGLGHGCFWFTFNDIRTAEFVINRMGEALLGGEFITSPTEQKLDALEAVFKENRFVIVWDNFEVAKGIEGTSVTPNLRAEDRDLLLAFLKRLRGSKSKVLITSRSTENWMGDINRYVLAIGGLDRDERWEYCEVVLRDLALTVDRNDKDMVELMDLLGGHTLAMRAIIPKLKDRSAGQLAAALRSNLNELALTEDEVDAKLAATLRFVEKALPDEQRPLLIPLAMHEGFVDADHLEQMAKQVDERWTRAVIDRFAEALCVAGLLRQRVGPIFEMHPALTGYLRATVLPGSALKIRDAWARAFVDLMGSLGDQLAPGQLHEQRFGFHVHGANFHHALTEAERLGMETHFDALIQSLGFYRINTQDYAGAARLFTRLAEAGKMRGNQEGEAAAYHQLGIVAAEQRDFAAAERWCGKSLAITEKQGTEHGAGRTYAQLGIVASAQRYFGVAEMWFRKALAVFEKLGMDRYAALTYHNLGRIAREQRQFAAAAQRLRKSLAIHAKLGNEHGAAGDYQELGRTAAEQRDFATAEQCYRQSLGIAAKLGDEDGAAVTYHNLGIIADDQGHFAAAEQWCRKSLAIKEKLGDQHFAALTYCELGIIAGRRAHFEEAARWLIKAIKTQARCEAFHEAGQHGVNYLVLSKKAPPDVQAKLKAMWQEAGLGDWPETET